MLFSVKNSLFRRESAEGRCPLTRRRWASLEEKPFLDADSKESALKKGEARIPVGSPRFDW